MRKIKIYFKKIKYFLEKYPAESFGVISILLLALSFVVTDYDINLKGEIHQVERRLHQKERLMESYAKQAMEVPVDKWVSFENLPEDMVLYKYNADTLQSWANQFPISNDETDIYPFLYRLQYMSNRNLYSTPLAYLGNHEQYVNLGSAWYVVKIYVTKYTKIITGILIKTEYPSDKIITNKVNTNLRLDRAYTTVPVSVDDGGVVFGKDGEPLFSIVTEGPSSFRYGDSPLRWFSFIFGIFALILYHSKKRSGISFVVAITGFTFIRFLALLMVSRIGTESPLFSPILYADTRLFNSLGNFLFNNLFVFLLVLTFFMVRNNIYEKFVSKNKWQKGLLISALFFLSFFLIFYIHSTLKSLILNSNIVLELFRIEEINFYSILCYISYSMLFLALLYSMQMIILFLRKNKKTSLFSWRNIILYILLISAYSVIVVSWFGLKKEFESNRVWTNKLAVERDLNLELQLRIVEDAIAQDPFIKILSLVSSQGNELIKSRINERYLFQAIRQKYNITVTNCGGNDLLQLSVGAPPIGCYSYFQEEVLRYGNQLAPNSRFYYMNNYDGLTSYLGLFNYYDPVQNKSVMMFLEIESKYVKDDIGYPGILLESQNFTDEALPKSYSYAKYTNKRLVSYRGRYNYPVNINDEEYKSGYSLILKNSEAHFVNKVSDDDIIIISRKRHSFFPYLVSFSYLSLFFGTILLLSTKWSRKSKLFTLPKSSFRRKITFLITFSMAFALICMGVGSVVYSINLTNDNNSIQMEEKIKVVQSTLSDYCKYALRYNDINTPELFSAMDRVASNTQTDINLYDTHGRLIRSTKSEIFDQFLIGSRINHNAYKNIVYEKSMRFVTKEKIAEIEYYSIFAPLFNVDGNLVAIANIPYFLHSVNKNESTASTVATIINIYLLLLIAATLGGTMVSNSLSKPLAEIKKKMEGLSVSKKTEHISYKNNKDELGLLVSAYNKMVDDLEESTQQLAQSEREQAWKEMARQIAHEIKNPLTPMRLSIQHIVRLKKQNVEGWENKFDELSKSLIEQIDILSETANEFSSFAKFYNEDNVDVDLDDLIKEQIVLFDNQENIDMRYVSEIHGDPIVSARKKQLARVFVNLLTNCIQALNNKNDGIIKVTLSCEQNSKGDYYIILFEDNGSGVTEENYNKLFKPNFTTKTGGTGLGLAICRSIVEQSQGFISYSTSTLGGACFTIKLPMLKK